MKSVVLSLSVLLLASCSGNGGYEKSAPASTTTDAAPAHVTTAQTATAQTATAQNATTESATATTAFETEIGCGQCVFHIDGVTGCSVAAKVDGKAVLVKGSDVDPHSLCAGPVRARVTGALDGPTFVATRVELLDAAEAAATTTAPAAATTATDTTTAHATSLMDVELGCAGCVFHMDGVKGCSVAAKVGDQVYKVEGGGVDPHSLCAGPQKAQVDGYIADGKLIAANVKVQQ